jgi:uncharacterized protein (UPF0548 family)
VRFRRPTDVSLRDMLVAAERATLTYPEVGATRSEPMPAGYRHDRYEARIAGDFDRTAAALLAWQAQIGAGVEVFPPGSRVEDGSTVVLLLRAGLWAPAPCRVVYVIAKTDEIGFAYGTLPGHPECGEVAFSLRRDRDGHARLLVRSFSRRVDPLARLAAPVARHVQKRVTRGYLEALQTAASGPEPA